MSRYTVYVTPHAWTEIKDLPGYIRQRVKRNIDALTGNPRPAGSKALETPEIASEIRRLRLDKWRIVYGVSEVDKIVDVLAVRKRPPYDYGDLEQLMTELM